jgi:flagellar biosynthesis protein FlhF
MRIKRVEAASVAEALRVLRQELGDNALILHTKTLRGSGVSGFFRSPRVEVLGAVDEPRTSTPKPLPATARAAAAERFCDSGQGAGRGSVAYAPSAWDRVRGRARRIAFVGPTGAGKTTTLAKVAARAQLEHRRRVNLITIDTYRIGAVPQLASYAAILGVPFEVAETPDDLAGALARAQGSDLVFIDTAGRSPRGRGIDELSPFMERAAADDICLVVGATTRPDDALRAAMDYARLRPNRLCITKLDETDDRGGIPVISRETGLPITWLGVGQEVPDDLEEAEPKRLTAILGANPAA